MLYNLASKVVDLFYTSERWRKLFIGKALANYPGEITCSTQTAQTTVTACKSALQHTSPINTVIDIGASYGLWAGPMMSILPNAKYLLVEAQTCHLEGLKKFCNAHKNAEYELVAAGKTDGVAYFDDRNPLGGLASETKGFNSCCNTEVPMRRIDSLIQEKQLKGPFLLKLDTHGFEVPIIEGAEETLKQTDIVVVETYIFRLNEKALVFDEFCNWMSERGFRCIDIAEPLWRPKDNAQWQMDMVFLKKDNPVFLDLAYE